MEHSDGGSSRSDAVNLTGGDVLVASETGSGKTGAFGLPVLQIVHEVLVERMKNEVVRGNHGGGNAGAEALTKQTKTTKKQKVAKTNEEGTKKDTAIIEHRSKRTFCYRRRNLKWT